MRISIAKYPMSIERFEEYVSLRHVDAATTFLSSAPLPNPVCNSISTNFQPVPLDYISTYG
jgi:hypothetical protein